MHTIQLQYVAECFIGLLNSQDDPEQHMEIMDAYFVLCDKAGVGKKTAIMSLYPDMTEGDYYRDYVDVD
jgi:hypothetical protein